VALAGARGGDLTVEENTVYVGRPTQWGNPTSVGLSTSRENAIKLYEEWLSYRLQLDPTFLEPLRGKDLACWCPLDKPCHADVLLKFLEEARQ